MSRILSFDGSVKGAFTASIDTVADAAKAVLLELESEVKAALVAANDFRHATLNWLHRALHDFALVAEARAG